MTTDPHDRPYTFGWHGEVVRRPSLTDDTPAEAWEAYADDEDIHGVTDADLADLAERDRATVERAWDEAVDAALDGLDVEYLPRTPYRKDADA